jgi:hypothetical protein
VYCSQLHDPIQRLATKFEGHDRRRQPARKRRSDVALDVRDSANAAVEARSVRWQV